MGRGKVPMKMMENKKARLQAFENRKKALEKKAEELSILCDVKIGMIVFGPDHDNPIIWPRNRDDEVKNLIASYESKSPYEIREYDLAAFFKDETKRMEKEMNKRKRKRKARENGEFLKLDESLSLDETKEVVGSLNKKIDAVRARINVMKEASRNNVMKEASRNNVNVPREHEERGGLKMNLQEEFPSNDDFLAEPFDEVIQAFLRENERRMIMRNSGGATSSSAEPFDPSQFENF